jgi:hypothetical protein
MKKTILFLLVLFLTASVFGRPVDEKTAKVIATNFITSRTSGKAFKTGTNLTLVYTSASKATNSSQNYFYVFNSDHGFILVSAEDNTEPVLGYSDEGVFSPDNIPYSVAKWLENYKTQIRDIINNNIQATTEIKENWINLKSGNPPMATMSTSTVSPLLATQWNQSPYFNDMCPYDNVSGKNAVTGCVATAMAQVLKYWNWPATGTGFHSYNDNTFGTQSASFGGTSYAWSSMPNTLSSSNTAVATLMYHCGVSVDMAYGVNESSAYVISSQSPVTNCAEYALKTYFGYQSSMSGIERANYNDGQWITLMENELNASRPVIYAGFGSGGGHCFVCDGFDVNNYLHMNWGWGGYYNGYFLSSALNPGGVGTGGGSGGYNNGQQAIIGIQPIKTGTSNIKLYDYVTPSAGSIYYGQSFTVTANVANYGTSDFNGDFCAAIFDNNNTFFDYVEIKSGMTLQANSYYQNDITFSYAGSYSMLPGTYNIAIYYRPTGGNWTIVSDNSSYSNYAQVKVIWKNDLEMYAPFSITPTAVVQGSSISVKCNIANYTTNQFSGTIDLSLYTMDGNNAFDIQQLTGMTLNGNSYYSNGLTFTNSTVTVAPGTYLLAVLYKPDGGGWQLAGSTYYQNPIKIVVKAPLLSPDKFEPDDNINQAYVLGTNFISDISYGNTSGSNCHTGTDFDFYRINLASGYDYTLNANLDDSRYDPKNLNFTLDAVFSYSTDGGNTWSDTYDDVMADAVIKGGGVLYFKVAPYFSGQTGTYMLEINLKRTPGSGISTLEDGKDLVRIYPNPAIEQLNIQSINDIDDIQEIKISDIQGNTVFSKLISNKSTREQVNVSDYPAGTYFVSIRERNGVINRKITIIK